MKICRDCLSKLPDSLLVCSFCKADVSKLPLIPDEAPPAPEAPSVAQRLLGVVLIIAGIGLGIMAVDSLANSRNVGSGAIRGLIIAPILLFFGFRKLGIKRIEN